MTDRSDSVFMAGRYCKDNMALVLLLFCILVANGEINMNREANTLPGELSLIGVLVDETNGLFPGAQAFSLRVAVADAEITGTLALESFFLGPGLEKSTEVMTGVFTGKFNQTSRQLSGQACFSRMTPNHEAFQDCAALLTLRYPSLRTVTEQFIAGQLRSLRNSTDAFYFTSISLQAESRTSYKYTRLKEAVAHCGSAGDGAAVMSNELAYSVLKRLSTRGLRLLRFKEQTSKSLGLGSNIPRWMILQIDEEDGGVHGFLQLFPPYIDNPNQKSGNNILAVEGTWNSNQMCMVACQTVPTGSAPISCSISVTLQMYSKYSIQQRSAVKGSVRSQRPESDPQHFESFAFELAGHSLSSPPGWANLSYIHSRLEEAEQLCHVQQRSGHFPDGSFLLDLFVDGVAINKGVEKLITVTPLFLDNKFQWEFSDEVGYSRSKDPIRTSFDVVTASSEEVYIAAEGYYDPSRGTSCMVGCKLIEDQQMLGAESSDLEQGKDCQVLIQVQYPHRWPGSHAVSGFISSLRDRNDPFYFEKLDIFASHTIYTSERWSRIKLRNMKLILEVLTVSLEVMAITFQLKSKAKLQQHVSLLMVFGLAIGHTVPVATFLASITSQPQMSSAALPGVESPCECGGGSRPDPFEARCRGIFVSFIRSFSLTVFDRNHPALLDSAAGSLQFRFNMFRLQLLITILHTAALVLLCWLFRLIWVSRRKRTTPRNDDAAVQVTGEEAKVLLICLPLYATITGLGPFFVDIKSAWSGVEAYSGLLRDLFLVPQLVAGVENVSPAFTAGTALSRLAMRLLGIWSRSWIPPFSSVTDWNQSSVSNLLALAWDLLVASFLFSCLLV